MMIDPLDLQAVRSWLWRTGRTLYRYARREASVNPETNGEYWILDLAVAHALSGPLTLFDVGANLGDWTAHARECLTRHHRKGMTYSFEPTPLTFQFLTQRFANDTTVRPSSLAVSDEAGAFTFHVTEMAGTNSLFGAEGGVRTQVQVTTVDDLLTQWAIERVTFLKSDTEGSDLAVLRGGARSLADGRIDVWRSSTTTDGFFPARFSRTCSS
jgi:FkbM family methyltransferase